MEATNLPDIKKMFSNEACMNNLKAMLGTKAQGFATSVLSAVSNNKLLQRATPQSIYTSAMVAASLDLPINQNLGFAALVPYGGLCQMQVMVKGLTQLAIRSGQYKSINNAVVYEGQLVKEDPFTGDYEFDLKAKKSDKIIGYVAYFKTIGGFEKYYYMTKEEVQKHGKKYSKTYGNGVWQTDFDSMALKTVLKMLLSKFGILSIEMQRAIRFDQASIKGDFNSVDSVDELEAEYVDNPNEEPFDEEKAKATANKFADFNNVDEKTGEIFGDKK